MDDFSDLCISALGGPVPWACVAYHFAAEPLLLLDVSTSQEQHLLLTGANFKNWLFGKVASYDSAMLKVTELFSKVILLPMFVYGDCMAMFSI
jgi:hypothetical protein